ncbi:hypothetical protein J6590_006196 [Homalodisca vitripennis]|nr:hypothetical protein J6590_101690 [Homalodisca vitripennis]KAG8328018.1 hypothetical protein J6590_006196 [Homalodisca vitripennis]
MHNFPSPTGHHQFPFAISNIFLRHLVTINFPSPSRIFHHPTTLDDIFVYSPDRIGLTTPLFSWTYLSDRTANLITVSEMLNVVAGSVKQLVCDTAGELQNRVLAKSPGSTMQISPSHYEISGSFTVQVADKSSRCRTQLPITSLSYQHRNRPKAEVSGCRTRCSSGKSSSPGTHKMARFKFMSNIASRPSKAVTIRWNRH